MPEPLRIGMVAGESSGDQLGAPLIAALKKIYPDAVFAGIGGERMIREGFDSLFDMERLSVMGFIDPLKRLPELLKIRRALYRHFLDQQFNLVVGIDAPDFNLGLELKLRKKNITTAHYVSPSVWAWRQGRIKKISRAVDHMLTLFPFEAEFYRDHQVPVTFVGHPLADQLPLLPDTTGARKALGLDESAKVVALMPGSRRSEIAMLANLFFEAARQYNRTQGQVQFVVPAANAERLKELQQLATQYTDISLRVVLGDSHRVMEAADLVLLASGTTALEAMLLKKPMIVAYRLGNMTYKLVSRLVKTPYVSLPNLLAGRELVPELIQDDATVDNIISHMCRLMDDQHNRESLINSFTELHYQLQQNNAEKAATTLGTLIDV